MVERAPYHAELADGPTEGGAVWIHADDGLRLRVAVWPVGHRGTVFLYPGRTEMMEKYGAVARDLGARGYAALAIDWRGQGLSDRMSEDVGLGHVGAFADYQKDAICLETIARDLDLPHPWFLLGHSMGGAIGLRRLINQGPFRAAVFSSPMWGIQMSAMTRPVAWTVPRMARAIGRGEIYTPGANRLSYLASAEFEDNTLTTDADQFASMKRQVLHSPEFALGGPSLHWLHEALEEVGRLAGATLPPVPALTAIGSLEAIVDPVAIRRLATRWPSCRIREFEGARHELLMERAEVRGAFLDMIGDLFDANGGAVAA